MTEAITKFKGGDFPLLSKQSVEELPTLEAFFEGGAVNKCYDKSEWSIKHYIDMLVKIAKDEDASLKHRITCAELLRRNAMDALKMRGDIREARAHIELQSPDGARHSYDETAVRLLKGHMEETETALKELDGAGDTGHARDDREYEDVDTEEKEDEGPETTLNESQEFDPAELLHRPPEVTLQSGLCAADSPAPAGDSDKSSRQSESDGGDGPPERSGG